MPTSLQSFAYLALMATGFIVLVLLLVWLVLNPTNKHTDDTQ